MSVPFATQLRSSRPPIFVASGPTAITIRVEASDLWDTVRVTALPGTTVSELKQKVVAALFSEGEHPDDFVLKLRGWEMLDPRASLSEAGVVDGSILLLAYRRRRPVR
ncbi:MAG TPA: hypothetical protein VF483_01825 [Gemmatimonadaceae bacterium]